MSAHTPRISVIVPVHDVEAHVGACIASLRAQTMGDFEALVIDDGSTDNSVARTNEAIGDDPRFRLIRQENRGLSGARNTGLDAARGEFVAFLDSDDRFAPAFLERMHAALVADGGGWVACAISLTFPDGTAFDHSAIHGAPEVQPGPARRVALDDCPRIVRHFPSAWNKLYRRDLIDGLRFPEGTWFEDHEFFWALVARAGHLLYLPEPLYLHARARPGQITGADDERVFEQFAVLERLAGLVRDSGAARPEAGLARLATRLIHERAEVLRNPGRRARFMRAAAEFLGRHGLDYSADWDPDISAAPGLVMADVLPLSVTLHGPGADPALAAATLRALEAQSMVDFELLSDDPAVAAQGHLGNGARITPLASDQAPDQARGRYLVPLRAGDQPARDCFKVWLNGMERLGAAVGVSGHECGTWERGHYRPPITAADALGAGAAPVPPSGGMLPLSPHAALRLEAEPGARIVRRDLAGGMAAPPDTAPLGAQAALLAQLHAAGGCAVFSFPALAIPPRPERGASPFALARGVRAARGTPFFADLPEGWEVVMLARGVQSMLNAAPGRGARLWLAAQAALAARLSGLRPQPGLPADQHVSPHLRRALGLAGVAETGAV